MSSSLLLSVSCSAVVPDLAATALYSITDDVVYKMSSSSNPVIGSAAVKILLLILEQKGPSVSPQLHERYKGNQSPRHITNRLQMNTDVAMR